VDKYQWELQLISRALAAPLMLSPSGVMSGNNNVLKLEHLYHFVGDKDLVECRFHLVSQAVENLLCPTESGEASRKISISSLGPVGHNDVGGPSIRTNSARWSQLFASNSGSSMEFSKALTPCSNNY